MLRCKKSLYYRRHRRLCRTVLRKINGKIKCCNWTMVTELPPTTPTTTPAPALVRKYVCGRCTGNYVVLNVRLSCDRSDRPHHGPCPSVFCPTVCPVRDSNLKTKKKWEKSKICMNVSQGRSDWCANFQV